MRYRYGRGTNRRQKQKLYFAAVLAIVSVLIGVSWLWMGNDQKNQLAQKQASGKAALPEKSADQSSQPAASEATVTECLGSSKKHEGLAASTASQLRKLAEYEQVCGGAVAEKVSFFVPTPTSATQAEAYAADTAQTLNEFAKFSISPLIFMEPAQDGQPIDITKFSSGAYDAALDAYFAALKRHGLTDVQMGTWVFLPEWNIPVWGSVDPGIFRERVTKLSSLQKKYFPASKASIMLESKTYPSATSWEGGSFTSFIPYVNGIPKGLIDSFGLQGFTWGPDEPGGPSQLDPNYYLRTDLAIEAAALLGAKGIWINTGTFQSFAAGTAKATVLSAPQRQEILRGVLARAQKLRTAGYEVAIHLFAENKSQTTEGIDWSYWATGKMDESPASPVLKMFVRESRAASVGVWIFDTD